ncbi:hypothetical protein [Paenibacillus hexagrammi]|nr:hypothetical protein [Paenibacillus sp. YPD9-1]
MKSYIEERQIRLVGKVWGNSPSAAADAASHGWRYQADRLPG